MKRKHFSRVIIFIMLVAVLLTSTDCARAQSHDEIDDPAPASILILSAEGDPFIIYGNKNIDWDAIGLDSEAIQFSEWEKKRIEGPSFFDKLVSVNKDIEICQDYGLIDDSFVQAQSTTVLRFITWLARVFYQYDYEYLLHNDFTWKEAVLHIAEQHKFKPLGNWWENPDSFILNQEIAIKILRNFLDDMGLQHIDAAKFIPNQINNAKTCGIIADLVDLIQPAESVKKFIYSETPVIPILIQPVYGINDKYNDFNGRAWRILNNDRNQTGYLSNGKPITEENIVELLKLIQQAFPDGMLWTSETEKSQMLGVENEYNNAYHNPGKEVKALYLSRYNVSATTACGGFASFVSDLLFGETANPIRPVDYKNLHVGDLRLENYISTSDQNAFGTTAHTVILTKIDNRNLKQDFAEGNAYRKISWNDWGKHIYPQSDAIAPENTSHPTEYIYYTRWPE